MWNKQLSEKNSPVSSGIDVTLQDLIALRPHVFKKAIAEKYKWLKLPGQKLMQVRGRGIEFDATREYQAGDDIRSMAWRVTARSLKPHIKVYREERERPVWLVVDLSPSLYFGTRKMFKSVCSIKRAAYLGWSHMLNRERIGAMIATPKAVEVHKPHTCEANFLSILHSLAKASASVPTFTDKNCLKELLISAQQQVRSGNLIFILSDYYQFDAEVEKLILHLAQRTQVVMTFVYDPFEAEAPPPHQYILTNGQQKMAFNMNDASARLQYQQQFQQKQQQLIDFSRKHHIALQLLRTDQETEE